MPHTSKLAIPLGNLSTPPINNTGINLSFYTDLSDTRFWREFAAGMKMFTRHLGRNNADLKNICQRNLNLLHNTFKQESLYQQLVQKIPTQASGAWNSIANSSQLHCGLVNIVARRTLSLNSLLSQSQQPIQGTSNQTPHTEQHQLFAEQGIIALLVLNGVLRLDTTLSNPLRRPAKSSNYLRPGNTQIMQLNALPHHIDSKTASCQLLVLAIPGCHLYQNRAI